MLFFAHDELYNVQFIPKIGKSEIFIGINNL